MLFKCIPSVTCFIIQSLTSNHVQIMPPNYYCINRLMHWRNQSTYDQVTFPKSYFWTLPHWKPGLQTHESIKRDNSYPNYCSTLRQSIFPSWDLKGQGKEQLPEQHSYSNSCISSEGWPGRWKSTVTVTISSVESQEMKSLSHFLPAIQCSVVSPSDSTQKETWKKRIPLQSTYPSWVPIREERNGKKIFIAYETILYIFL
jgi:hypothetical protein